MADGGNREATIVIVEGDPKKRKRNEADITESLRDYERVVVLTENREHLPVRFPTYADAVIDAPAVSGRDIAAAVRALFGAQMAEADTALAATASLDIVTGAFRKSVVNSIAMPEQLLVGCRPLALPALSRQRR